MVHLFQTNTDSSSLLCGHKERGIQFECHRYCTFKDSLKTCRFFGLIRNFTSFLQWQIHILVTEVVLITTPTGLLKKLFVAKRCQLRSESLFGFFQVRCLPTPESNVPGIVHCPCVTCYDL